MNLYLTVGEGKFWCAPLSQNTLRRKVWAKFGLCLVLPFFFGWAHVVILDFLLCIDGLPFTGTLPDDIEVGWLAGSVSSLSMLFVCFVSVVPPELQATFWAWMRALFMSPSWRSGRDTRLDAGSTSESDVATPLIRHVASSKFGMALPPAI